MSQLCMYMYIQYKAGKNAGLAVFSPLNWSLFLLHMYLQYIIAIPAKPKKKYLPLHVNYSKPQMKRKRLQAILHQSRNIITLRGFSFLIL